MGNLKHWRRLYQPVLVLGPRAVGKTSLITQWLVPWDYAPVEPSRAHRVCAVPVSDLEGDQQSNPLDPDLPSPACVQLGLRLHDFPGEIDVQRHILMEVEKETLKLRKNSRKNLGVVLICMFGADEAKSGIRPETNQYYNGQLFHELRRLFAHGEIDLTKLIVVYNKMDLLRRQAPGSTDEELLALCQKSFAATCEPLRAILNPAQVREVATVLSRDEAGLHSERADTVKAEAIRPLVEALQGPRAPVDGRPTPPTWNL
jgi:hypothetical protein